MVPEWYYADQGQQRGPVSFGDLQALIDEGRLKPSDLVWKTGWPEWVAAGTQPGLFAAPPKAPRETAIDSDWAPPREEPVPYEPPFTRLPQQSSRGSGFGALAVISGVGIFVLCIGCGVIAAVIQNGPIAKAVAGKSSPERSWSLATGQHQSWTLPFNQGDDVTIKVRSDFDSDVDLFVFTDEFRMNALLRSGNVERNVGFCVAFDNSPSKDCNVRFVAPQTGTYYVVVANRNSLDQPHRNRANTGKLTFYPVR
jgi:hypothetical protein